MDVPAQMVLSVRVVSDAPGEARDDRRPLHLVVEVRDAAGQTVHDVTLDRALLARLAPGDAPEDFVRRSFAFLLEREPKESILRRFDISVIPRYFPEFETSIARRR